MKSLTIEQLKALKVGDWVWIVETSENSKYYGRKHTNAYGYEETEYIRFAALYGLVHFEYSDYGKSWLAYKNKEQVEAKERTCRCKNSCANCNADAHISGCNECPLYQLAELKGE